MDKLKYIKENVGRKSRRSMANELGVCAATLYKLIRDNFPDAIGKKYCPNEKRERNARVVELYKSHSIREIAEITGISYHTIAKIAYKHGARHDEKTSARIMSKQRKNLSLAYSTESIMKRVETRKRTFKMERFRMMSGEPQKTRLKVYSIGEKAYAAKYNLIRRHGYFAYEGDQYLIGYDKNTDRVDESHYTDKYNFKFMEEEKCQEE